MTSVPNRKYSALRRTAYPFGTTIGPLRVSTVNGLRISNRSVSVRSLPWSIIVGYLVELDVRWAH
ncbi:hypothetical protein GB937_006571 [Aspergillus fischeri]|nr:hypothetical protein GB937_006571 [Aspergillus fischeri]